MYDPNKHRLRIDNVSIQYIYILSKHMFMHFFCFDRDLKPTNVLLDEDDRPVLMDLGSMNRARIEVRPVITF